MPSTHSDNKVVASGPYEYEEAEVASGNTVYPGMIVERTGENSDYEETPTVQPVGTADKLGAEFLVVLTPESPPRGSDTDIPREHEYDAGENIQIAVCQPGCKVQNLLLADGNSLTGGGSANVSYDDPLVSHDDGAVKSQSTAGAIFARVTENGGFDNSTGSASEGAGSMARINAVVV